MPYAPSGSKKKKKKKMMMMMMMMMVMMQYRCGSLFEGRSFRVSARTSAILTEVSRGFLQKMPG
jgi:hypothetical protein